MSVTVHQLAVGGFDHNFSYLAVAANGDALLVDPTGDAEVICRAVEAAGAFAVVLECMPADLGGELSRALAIPTIGIGSGVQCDGQIQVLNDVLGLFEDFTPKHSRRYAELGRITREALQSYANDVRNGSFPGPENSFQ